MPVPYVAFASPGAKQPWPKSAACWSPAIPATGSVTPRNDASAADPGRGDDLGKHGAVDPEQGEQLVVPLARREIEQHRPRRVRHVGDVRRPARQLPHEPRVDRPERELRLRLLDPRQDPLELRRREVRVGDEPRSLADQRGRQLRAALGGAPVLPDDRGMHRPAGAPLPDDGRLALVRDPDRRRARERPHQRRRAPRPRSARRSPRSPPGRARPSRARGSAAGSRDTRARPCAARGRRRGTSCRSSPGRWPGSRARPGGAGSPSARARAASRAGACAGRSRRGSRPSSRRGAAARRSPCTCSRGRSAAAPRARAA